MIEDCVIIGGGVAGLSAANQLVDLGLKPLLIDGGEYPSHRICGEFFSHESHSIIHNWSISLTHRIHNIRFIKGHKTVEFSLPIPAGSGSHYDFDIQLYERAIRQGAKALCKTTVLLLEIPQQGSKCYSLKLSNNETIQARHLIIGTGKLPQIYGMKTAETQMKYYGIKAHFEGLDMGESLEMHLLPGGYLGISNVNAMTTNVAAIFCINSRENVKPENILDDYLKNRMKPARMVFPKWLTCLLPEFGIRNNPELDRVFWIGDAAGGIPPVSGAGLTIAMTSGCMAAEYLVKSTSQQFKKDWLKRYRKRFFWAKMLHRGMIRPWINEVGMGLCQVLPHLPIHAWELTRE